jgi:hypothetical protein
MGVGGWVDMGVGGWVGGWIWVWVGGWIWVWVGGWVGSVDAFSIITHTLKIAEGNQHLANVLRNNTASPVPSSSTTFSPSLFNIDSHNTAPWL